MKLYELPRDQNIKIYGLSIGGPTGPVENQTIIFGHIDGMYSYCWVEGQRDTIPTGQPA